MVTNDWRAYLTYTTQRRLRVDVWQIGLAFKLLQLAILIFLAVDIFTRNAWAHSEVPAGRVNAYGEKTDAFDATVAKADNQVKYCSSDEHDYVFDPKSMYKYEKPACRALEPEEAVTKGIGAVTFTTSVIESTEFAWKCGIDDADAQYKERICNDAESKQLSENGIERSSVKNGIEHSSGTVADVQCKCLIRETYYVKGVEHMGIVFEHGYSTTSKAGSLEGSSEVSEHGLSTQIGPNKFKGGDRIKIPLEQLIALNSQGRALNTTNADAGYDGRSGKDSAPFFRVTGMKLKVDIEYENLYSDGMAGAANKDVDAKIKVSADGGWAGPGAQVFYMEAPSFDATSSTHSYAKMVRYRQGVEVVFVAAGAVYWFDYQHFITVFMGAYLFLAIAVYVMDFVAFNVLPNGVSKVLYAKRAERVSKVHSFAQLGLKAAVAVKDFKALDVDNQGFVEVKDLVAVFGAIPSVSKDEAMMMAHTIMRAADRDTSLQGRLTFNEFMSLFDGTTALNFDQYVKLVHTTGKAEKLDEQARNAASQAYDDVAAGVDIASRRSSDPTATAQLPTRPDGTTPEGPTTIDCFLCKTKFGVPPGAKLVKCPQCLTTNPTDPRPPAQQPGLLGGLGLGGINLTSIPGMGGTSNAATPARVMQDV